MRTLAHLLVTIGLIALVVTVLLMTAAFNGVAAHASPNATMLTQGISYALVFAAIGGPCLLTGLILMVIDYFRRSEVSLPGS